MIVLITKHLHSIAIHLAENSSQGRKEMRWLIKCGPFGKVVLYLRLGEKSIFDQDFNKVVSSICDYVYHLNCPSVQAF